jgi:hypothetical protein
LVDQAPKPAYYHPRTPKKERSMETPHQRLAKLGTAIPELLLPKASIDLEAWAVIACDQFTQDRRYWEKAETRVGPAPSTLRMIYPELYLDDGDRSDRIGKIRAHMETYLSGGVFAPALRACMYLERRTPYHGRRRGLVLAVDLERYEWAPEARPLIRATEGTVRERIPPRMEIRRGAPLELPHIILLIDDDERSLIEGLGERARQKPASYDTSLMLDGGSLKGWAMEDSADWEYLATGLERLAKKAQTRYGANAAGANAAGANAAGANAAGANAAGASAAESSARREDPFLFAVGDGNHSLATAKAVWDEHKAANRSDPAVMDHPARYALVEVENIYDEGIDFEPIHRVVFGTNLPELISALSALPGCAARTVKSAEELALLVAQEVRGNRYGLVSPEGFALVECSSAGIATEPLQPLLDAFAGQGSGRTIDYLHGTEETFRVALEAGVPRVGILLPPVGKKDLFATVARSGPLPRKSFSMGEALEKRFYLDCRSLFR